MYNSACYELFINDIEAPVSIETVVDFSPSLSLALRPHETFDYAPKPFRCHAASPISFFSLSRINFLETVTWATEAKHKLCHQRQPPILMQPCKAGTSRVYELKYELSMCIDTYCVTVRLSMWRGSWYFGLLVISCSLWNFLPFFIIA